jgi:hypothetical protein
MEREQMVLTGFGIDKLCSITKQLTISLNHDISIDICDKYKIGIAVNKHNKTKGMESKTHQPCISSISF